MEPLKKDEALLEQARNESLDRRYARARRTQSVAFILGLVVFSLMGVSLFSNGSLLHGFLAMALCIVFVAGYMHSAKLSKEAFLARNTRPILLLILMIILAAFAAILVGDLFRAGGA
jgi:lipopolysaccharide export LptBFGC system permease protein LptF